MVNKGFSGERGLQIVVALSRFQHNVAGFINDGGEETSKNLSGLHSDTNCLCATQKTPGIQQGCRLNAHCQKHNCLSTHLGRQGVNWFPYTLSPWIPKLKKNTPDTPRRLPATSQLVPTTQAGRIKKHEGRGCKVACQAYSSIFHTHARASDLVKVFVRRAAPPCRSSLSLLVHTVDTDRVPVYCSGISMLPVWLWLWQAHTGLVIISHMMSSHWWWCLKKALFGHFLFEGSVFHDETRWFTFCRKLTFIWDCMFKWYQTVSLHVSSALFNLTSP